MIFDVTSKKNAAQFFLHKSVTSGALDKTGVASVYLNCLPAPSYLAPLVELVESRLIPAA